MMMMMMMMTTLVLKIHNFRCLVNPSLTYLYKIPVFTGTGTLSGPQDPEYEGRMFFESSVTLYLLQSVTTP